MVLLEAKNLSHAFDYPLFEGVDFTLEEGERVAITGVSGSGKSTLLHILSSFLEPNSGTVDYQGDSVYSLSPSKLTALRRYEFGLIFQNHYLFKGFSAQENLEIASMLVDDAVDTELLKLLNIESVMHQKITELSGGQQQRVSIARVLNKHPRVIFADEPTGNLDHNTSLDVIAIFEAYTAKHSAGMVMVTHDEEIAKRCDRIFHLEGYALTQE